MRLVVVPVCYDGFTPTNVVKTEVQVLYNLMKGGLDSNIATIPLHYSFKPYRL